MAKRSQLSAADYTLSRREVQKIIHAAVSFRDRCVVKTLYQTALRRFELRALDVRDIDWAKRRVHIPKGKGDKERHVFLTEDLAADLRHLLGRRRTGPVFQSNRGTALSLKQINNIVAAAGEKAGVANPNPRLKHINPHLLRHSFARHWKDAGRSIESLSAVLGHQSTATTMDVYGREDIDQVQANYEAVVEELV